MCPVYLHCPGNKNNVSTMVCYSSQNTSKKNTKARLKQGKIQTSQKSKMGTHRNTHGMSHGLTCVSNWKQKKYR